MAKKTSKSSTFKYNDTDDKIIYDALEEQVIDKSQFIKNALYYYIVKVQSGDIIDRNLPQSIQSKSNIETLLQGLLNKGDVDMATATDDTNQVEELEAIEDEEELEIYVPSEFDDLDDDNFDVI